MSTALYKEYLALQNNLVAVNFVFLIKLILHVTNRTIQTVLASYLHLS